MSTRNLPFYLLLSILFFGAGQVMAQRSHAFGAGVGTSYYYGDLTDKFNNALIRPAGSITYTNYLLPVLAFRVGASVGEVGAADATALDESRQRRNLHFRSLVSELSAVLVYEIIPDKNFGNAWVGKPHVSPYIFGGVAMFHFNPQARVENEWIDLQPLGTEGQFIAGNSPGPYARINMSVPFGGGINLRLTEYTGISFEVGYRLTFTDYLDDVSTVYPDFDQLREASGDLAVRLSDRSLEGMNSGGVRGNPDANDGYFFTMISINYYLNRYQSRD
jgi:hypothetical protein